MSIEPFDKLFATNRLMPSVTLDSPDIAPQVAKAFLEGGLSVMEVTFRTEVAAGSIRRIRETLPAMRVGAGTLLTPEQVMQAHEAGAEFGLSPGWNPRVTDCAMECGLPFIPGVSTPSEIERAIDAGFLLLKIFPVEQLGGPGFLKSLEGPYGPTGVGFVPMGGIGPANLSAYAACRMLFAAGGSWLLSSGETRSGDLSRVPARVRESVRLVGTRPD